MYIQTHPKDGKWNFDMLEHHTPLGQTPKAEINTSDSGRKTQIK
jgi:hypothetical protein